MEDLIARFTSPTPLFLHTKDESDAGSLELNKLAPCCLSCLSSMNAAAQSCSALTGVAGVLDMLQRRIKWGYARCDFLCECFERPGELDCGAGMALALIVLNSIALKESEKSLRFLSVQLVKKINSSQHQDFNANFKHTTSSTENATWIGVNCMYHQVVGVVDTLHKTVALWDFGQWEYGQWLLPSSDTTQEESILAVRLVNDASSSTLTSEERDETYWWRDREIKLNEWSRTQTLPQNTTNDMCAQKFKSLNDLFACATGSHGHLTSFDSEQGSNSDQLAQVTVCVSGCHMSAIPCSGVGKTTCKLTDCMHLF